MLSHLESESESEAAQSCLTLCDPMDCSPPGSSVHGILQARILEWVAISFSRGSSLPGDRTQVSCIAGRHFNLWATRKALSHLRRVQLFVTLWTVACQSLLSTVFSWQECWSGLHAFFYLIFIKLCKLCFLIFLWIRILMLSGA